MNVILFPGQGAQYVGMGKSLHEGFPEAKNIFDSVDEILGFKLSEKCFQGSAEELKDTAIQQLAILTVSLAAFEAFKTKNKDIGYLSGLSLGEYSCLYAGSVVSLADLVLLVKTRAQAMQKAALNNPSTMFAVIGLDLNLLGQKAKEGDFHIANINSAQQVVVSLAIDDKAKVKSALESLGAKVIELEVSGGFHSPFMNQAKSELKEVVQKISFSDSQIPIVSNVTAKAHTSSSEIKENLIEQLISPVLWKSCIDYLLTKGTAAFYEVGPSKVLKGLMRKISPQTQVVNIEKKEDLDKV